ncbi:hypothetical protein GCM10029964_054030 [Kibdelosporangium lantanae]
MVGKLGLPRHPDVAMGAITGDGVLSVNDDDVRGFGISPDELWATADEEARELARRERFYRDDTATAVPLTGRYVIIIDDGLATGAAIRAAIRAVRAQHPARIVVAVPAASMSTCEEMSLAADEAVCATSPSPFFAVGDSYWDSVRTTDEEVRDLLRTARQRRTSRDG